MQVKPAEYLFLTLDIAEGDVSELDIALRFAYLDRVLAVGDVGLHIHYLTEALDARNASAELLAEINDRPYRAEQGRDEQQACGEVAGSYLAEVHEVCADADNDDIHDAVDERDHRVEGRHILMRRILDRYIFGAALEEFLTLGLLIGKGTHYPHAEQAVLQPCVYLADLVAAAAEGVAHPAPRLLGEYHHERHEDEYAKGKAVIHRGENIEARKEFDNGGEYHLREMMRPLRNVKQVGGHAAHKLADLGVVKEIERERLQVVKHIRPHLILDLNAHHMAVIGFDILRQAAYSPQDYVEKADLDYLLQRQCRKAARGGVCYLTHYERQDYLARRGERRAQQHHRESGDMLLEIRKKAFDKLDILFERIFAPFLFGRLRSHGSTSLF